MSELEQTRERLDAILGRIPVSGSFEAARLSKEPLELGDKLVQLCLPPEAANKTALGLEKHLENAGAI